MPTLSTLLAFLPAALGILLLPGPNVIYILTCSAAQGRRAGLASVGGIELANVTHVAAAALGLSTLLLTSELAFSLVRYLGVAYLMYLGASTLLARGDSYGVQVLAHRSLSRLFARGFLVNLLNPKAALIFYALLPQFVDPSRGNAPSQIATVGGLFILLATSTDTLYALLGGAAHVVALKRRFQRHIRYATGGIYLLLAVAAAVGGSRKITGR